MADREKVIKEFEHILNEARGDYLDFADVTVDFGEEILALLKGHEPKQIVRIQVKCENSDGSIDYFAEWYCPHFGKLLSCGFGTPWVKFCHKCGGAVNWE